jgi:hypothetical protein
VLPARAERGVDEQLVVLEELSRDLSAAVRVLALDVGAGEARLARVEPAVAAAEREAPLRARERWNGAEYEPEPRAPRRSRRRVVEREDVVAAEQLVVREAEALAVHRRRRRARIRVLRVGVPRLGSR